MTDRATLVKCLVWDLDNTLWHGTLLEDDEVVLADAVRAVVTTLDSRGILQSIASKNDHDMAWDQLERFGVAEYFVLPEIDWGPKSAAVRSIAEELSFAHNTIAFIDDQPAERAEVAFHLPDVRCYSADQVLSIVDMPEFDPPTVTVDARRRRQMYQAGFQRVAEKSAFTGSDDDFVRSLDLVMCIERASGAELSRVEELTRRTSQMNATGVPYSDATLRALVGDPAHEVLTVTMTDRFGPHGAVGVLLLAKHPGVWHLKLLATSCRVVSFGAGAVILNWLIDHAARSCVHLVADFRRTERNRLMEIAYRFAGFEDESCPCLATTATPEHDIQQLHLTPALRPEPDTMRLTAPDLAGVAEPA